MNERKAQTFVIGASVVVALISFTLQAFPENLQSMLIYERDAIQGGEWWRMLTAHFIHLNWAHYFMNVAGLGIITILFLNVLTATMLISTLFFGAMMVSLGLYRLSPEIEWYVGLSGVLHCLLATCLLKYIQQFPRLGWTLLLLLIGKLALEAVTGTSLGTIFANSVQVINEAHIYGTVGGILTGAVLMIRNRNPGKAGHGR